ncbi:MAG: response regulator transcription factor [Nevskiales bacterium]
MSRIPAWLVVDDDAAFCAVLSRALTRRGHAVVTACDAASALHLAGQHPLSHAVLDLKLGTDSGLELIGPLLRLRPGLRIVVLTGYASISTAVEAVRRGACNYLCKPVDAQTVLAAFVGEHAHPDPAGVAQSPISLRRLEWEHIQRILTEHAGNISAAARTLGMHRRTLQRRLAKRPVRG